ncbi:MAG: prepilin-type N-terminal cleavage/methylation domain-containing protein [Candidatus Saccharimonas sp.]
MKYTDGFTLVEVLVTIVVLGILLSIVVFIPVQALPRARDTERLNDVASIARRLEQAYTAQEVGTPSYPSTTRLLSDISSNSGTVARLGTEAVRAPRASGSSVVAATSTSTMAPKGTGSPVLGEYVYQPLTRTGTLCTGTSICTRFFLYYRTEVTNIVVTTKSIRQQ